MNSKLTRTVVVAFVAVISSFAVLGIMYVFDLLTQTELKEYATKVGVTVLILSAASALISLAVSVGRHKE